MLGKKRGDVHLAILVFRDPPDDVFEPGTGIDIIGLATGDERVHHGSPDGGCVVPAEEIVLAPQSQRPDGILDGVVVDEPVPVIDIHRQLGETFVGVLHGFPYQGAFLVYGYLASIHSSNLRI